MISCKLGGRAGGRVGVRVAGWPGGRAGVDHLAKIFTPNEVDHEAGESEIEEVLSQVFQLDLPIAPTNPREIIAIIKRMEDKKASIS
ncbi:jg19058 [Pararge aegeria aegeria]|uniref:Jg19058 protein n=1 Tax=Pararge aegeria aegeria TaxID=348720 RepID=A0A8S4SII6_9NEOP|nr:jg19058 [Pararge aegeria aegeria]